MFFALLFDIKTILKLPNIIDRNWSKKQIYLKAKAVSNVNIMHILPTVRRFRFLVKYHTHYKGYEEHSHCFALIFIFPTARLAISRPQALACGLEIPSLASMMLVCNIQEIECYKKRGHVMIATRSIWFIRRWWSPMSTDNKCDVGLRLIAHCESGGKLWFSGAEGRHSVWPRRGTAERHAAPSAQKLPPDYIR